MRLILFFIVMTYTINAKELIDYNDYENTISLEELRAGTHDLSGVNQYFFNISIFGFVNDRKERKLAIEKKKHVKHELGKLPPLNLNSLSIWQPDKRTKEQYKFTIEGDKIRLLVAEMMTLFNLKEQDVVVQVVITLLEEEREFIFLNADKTISDVYYYLIPYKNSELSIRKNHSIEISDEKGVHAKLAISFKSPKKETIVDVE